MKAIAVNLTATTTAAAGYLIAWPAAAAVPATSNLNYSTGQTISNSAIIELDNLGRLAVKAAAGGADVLIDVAGWYGDPAAVSYTYNANGAQTVKTTTGAGAATISYVWDPQGRLCNTIKAAAVNPGCTTQPAATATTRNTYTGDGQRLIRRDTTTAGLTTRTLYLDGQELTSNNGATATATRYYSAGGATVAVRNATGLTWLFGDHQGTASITITADATATVTRQRYTPYGAQRGTPNKLDTTTERGFLGQTEDNNTGLTYLNARYYDPNLTRFISVDPLATPANPQTLNPYTYALNNPVTYADPTGLCVSPNDPESIGFGLEDCPTNYDPEGITNEGSGGGSDDGSEGDGGNGGSASGGMSGTGAVDLNERLPDRYRSLESGDSEDLYEVSIKGFKLNQAEVRYCESVLFGCEGIFLGRNYALTRPGVDGSLGAGNARQHMYWAVGNFYLSGEPVDSLDAHENIVHGSGGTMQLLGPLDDYRRMDLINNDVGLQIAQEVWGEVPHKKGSMRGMATETRADYFRRKDVQAAIDRKVNESIQNGAAVWINESSAGPYAAKYNGFN